MNRSIVPDERRADLTRVATDLAFCSDRLDRKSFRDPDRDPTYERTLQQEERAYLAPLVDDGFEVVGTGIARCVLEFPSSTPCSGNVVKLARFGVDPVSQGAVQNHREAMLWARHKGGDWPLAPVLDYEPERFAWLVMPSGEPIEERPETERERLLDEVRYRARFLHGFDMREVFEENVVLIDDEPLLADYGLPEGL